MKTDGWELSLSWRDSFKLGGKPFDYSIKAMVWDSKSVITKYVNDTRSLGTVKGFIENGGSPSSYYVGMTVGEIWGYTVAGLFRDQADIDSSAIHDFVQASDKVTRPGRSRSPIWTATASSIRAISPSTTTATCASSATSRRVTATA